MQMQGEHRAMQLSFQDEHADVTTALGHGDPSVSGSSGSFPHVPGCKEQCGNREAEGNSTLSSKGSDR